MSKIKLLVIKLLLKAVDMLSRGSRLPNFRSPRDKITRDYFKVGQVVYQVCGALRHNGKPGFVEIMSICEGTRYGSGIGLCFLSSQGVIECLDSSWVWTQDELDQLNKN